MKNALARVSVDNNDPVVYHYCSSIAFESIIESGCFWATDLRSMNDPREVKSSISTVLKFLEDMRFSEGSPSAELLDHTTRAFNKYNGFVRFFCSSFTYSRDDLYSWLNYGSRGTGFAIGIRKSRHLSFYWRDVTYSDDFLREKLRNLWDMYIAELSGGTALEEVSRDLAISLQREAVSNKHASWSNEREARMIFPILITESSGDASFNLDIIDDEIFKEKKVKFNSSPSGLRPFIEVNLIGKDQHEPNMAISEVMIGSNNSSELEVVKAFLSANGLAGTTVSKSGCEFR